MLQKPVLKIEPILHRDKNGIKSEIKPNEVYEFYFADGIWSDTYFESVILTDNNENRVFLIRLINGKIKMFVESNRTGGQTAATYYL